MLKRTTGRLLLTLLVITGLAGTINKGSLSQKERKQAINLIRSGKNEVLSATEGLSARQLNFKPTPKDQSIAEVLKDMASLQKAWSDRVRSIMEAQGNAEYRLKIELTDEQLLSADQAVLMKAHFLPGEKIYYKDPAEATRKFVALCDHHIKYLRTSTEDLRNHVVLTPVGWIDCYQYLLLLADQSSYFAEKINQVKSSRGFPKK